MLYPAIAACLREEGLNADITGPRPHGFGVTVTHNDKHHEFMIDLNGQFIHYERGTTVILNTYDLANPNIWKQIKEIIEQPCSTKPSPNA